jgi:hypothetical protein
VNREKARRLIEAFDFENLFANDLLWNRHRATVIIEADGQTFDLKGVAEKSGVQVFRCPPLEDGKLAPYSLCPSGKPA